MNLTRSWSCPFMSRCTFTTYMGNKQGCTCFGCFCSAPGRAPHAPIFCRKKATSVAKKLEKCWVQYWYSVAKSTETTSFCRNLQRLHLEAITFWNPFVWSCKLQPYFFVYQLHQFQHWAVKNREAANHESVEHRPTVKEWVGLGFNEKYSVCVYLDLIHHNTFFSSSSLMKI